MHDPHGEVRQKTTRHVLAVVPGGCCVDFEAVRNLFEATYVSFASPQMAERLAGSVAGTVLPFAFNPELEVIADPGLNLVTELYFNAAGLDRSLALNTADYFAIDRPRLAQIAEAPRKMM